MNLLYFNVLKEELYYYSKLDNTFYIPRLDKPIIVDSNSLSDKQKELLVLSGYSFWHLPTFCMKGHTYDYNIVKTNKHISDAAKINSENIKTYSCLF